MKLIHASTSCLVHLLLLAELFVQSSSRPTSSPSLCGMFGSMTHHVERVIHFSKNLHGLTDEELTNFAAVEHRLGGLPHLQHDAEYFNTLQVNKSLSQLFLYTQSFKQHIDWLKTAKENFSLPSESAESASTHLLKLSNLINTSLNQIHEEVPQAAAPSLPVVSTAFDVLQFSVELSERLQVFCNWSKRVLRHFQKQSRCPKH